MNPQATGSGEETGGGGAAVRLRTLPRRLIGAVIAVGVVVAVVLWLALKGGGTSTPAPQSQRAGGGAVSQSAAHKTVIVISSKRLTGWAKRLSNPIYWAGPQPGFQYEVTQSSKGWIYIGYVPPGEKVSASTPLRAVPFVGTFPFPKAYERTLAVARGRNSVRIRAPANEVAFYYKAYPTSVYLAFKGSDYQIEVFNPSLPRIRELITSGAIKPVAPSVRGGVAHP